MANDLWIWKPGEYKYFLFLNEFLQSFTDFFYFTRSFKTFADPNGDKLNKILTRSCWEHNRIIFLNHFFCLWCGLSALATILHLFQSYRSTMLMCLVNSFKLNFHLLLSVYFLVNVFLVSLLVYFSNILQYYLVSYIIKEHHISSQNSERGMTYCTPKDLQWFSLSISHRNISIYNVKVSG